MVVLSSHGGGVSLLLRKQLLKAGALILAAARITFGQVG